MMKTHLMKVMFLFTGLVVLLSACVDKTYDFNTFSNYFQYNPKIAVPVAHGNLTIQNLLKEIDTSGYVRQDNSGFLSLVYDKPIESISANSAITIPTQNFSKSYSSTDAGFPTTFPVGKSSVSIPHSNNFSFTFNNGEQIDSMRINKCTLNMNLNSTFNQSGTLTLYFPTIKLNGKPFRKVLTVSKGANITSTDISGYTVYFTKVPSINSFPVNDTLTLEGSGIIAGNLQIKASLTNINFQSLFGYIGKYNLVSAKDSFLLDIFSNAINGNIAFDNPKLTVIADNSVGVPVNITLQNVISYSSIANLPVPMTFTSAANPFPIAAPTLKEFGQVKTSVDSINKSNSNIVTVIANTPKYLAFEVSGQTNPSGPGTYNFITDTSQIHLNFEINLPLSFKTSTISTDSIFDFDFNKDFSDNDKINSLLFHLEAANSLPLDVSLQVYFLDDAYLTVDTMFSSANLPQLVSGTVDANGKVTTATSKTVEVTYDKARITNMKKVKHARIRATLITANKGQQFVKVYSQNGINFKLGVQAQIQYTDNL